MSQTTESCPGRKLCGLNISSENVPFALGYVSRSHDIAVERLDALIAYPGDKRTLLATLRAIRDDLVDGAENLRGYLERQAAPAKTDGGA